MFGDGIVSLGSAVVTTDFRYLKSFSKIVPELDRQVAGRSADAADLVDEVHVPGRAAELAIGRRLEADLFLHRDHVLDGRVLDFPQPGGVDLAGSELGAGTEQEGRAEQAADVVGAERRRGAHV
jgi:hypothetical protein